MGKKSDKIANILNGNADKYKNADMTVLFLKNPIFSFEQPTTFCHDCIYGFDVSRLVFLLGNTTRKFSASSNNLVLKYERRECLHGKLPVEFLLAYLDLYQYDII